MRFGNVFRVMLIALCVCFVAQAASAQKRWIFLGDKHVDGHDDHDKISISSKEGTFRQRDESELGAVATGSIDPHADT